MPISVTQDVKVLEKAVRDCNMDWPNASSGSLLTSNLGRSGCITEVDTSDGTAMVSNDIGWVPIGALTTEQEEDLESEEKDEQALPAIAVGMSISVTQDIQLLEKAVRDCDMDWPNALSGSLWTSNLGKSGCITEVDSSDGTALVSNDIGWVPVGAIITEQGQEIMGEFKEESEEEAEEAEVEEADSEFIPQFGHVGKVRKKVTIRPQDTDVGADSVFIPQLGHLGRVPEAIKAHLENLQEMHSSLHQRLALLESQTPVHVHPSREKGSSSYPADKLSWYVPP